MNADAIRVIEAIAADALGGNGDLAARVLADLDEQGWVHTDTMGGETGWLTPQGRTAAVLHAALS